jgi:y4mF family transcriptional regulator
LSWCLAALATGQFPFGNIRGLQACFCRNIPDQEIRVTAEEIGIVVRQARLAQGLRQDQLAAAAGVGLRFLVELERGKPTVRLDKVLAVLSALGYRLDVAPPPKPAGRDA